MKLIKNTMDNFQLLSVSLFIVVLWCVIVPCLSTAIYLFLTKSSRKRARTYFAAISIALALVIIGQTEISQSINPLCAGMGIPDKMACTGYGFVSNSDAIAITNAKTLSDLIRTLGIPAVVSFGFALIAICIHSLSKAKTDRQAD